MIKHLVLLCLVYFGNNLFFSNQKCDCNQIEIQKDCLNVSNFCKLDDYTLKCQDKTEQDQQMQEQTSYCRYAYQYYCFDFLNSCQWVDNACSHFTGCEAFYENEDQKCQNISRKCISNGEQCIEIAECEAFKSQTTCLISIQKKYCYWNDITKSCSQATDCSQLPKKFSTDQECRSEIETCTANIQGGCQLSGIQCSDQKYEIQCVYDQNKQNNCFWFDNSCFERKCDNAPSRYISDYECTKILYKCTTTDKGGCRIRTTCKEANIQEACTFDQYYQPCYWDGSFCFEKVCENAPSTFNTEKQCNDYLSTCTMRQGGGCRPYQECSDIKQEAGCKQDINGNECIFDQKCRQKECKDAPFYYDTNQECQLFYPNSILCLAQTKRGCYSVQECKNILNQDDCKYDSYNNICNWNEQTKECKNNNSFCSNFLDKQQCSSQTELSCNWTENCYKKECVFAPKTIHQYHDCQNYQENCTLNVNGQGCSEIPLVCEANLSEKSCWVRGNYQGNIFFTFDCFWGIQGCKDYLTRTCDQALRSFTMNYQCQNFSEDCVIKNPYDGKSNGCRDNPEECSYKRVEDACITYNKKYNVQCLWDNDNSLCIEKTCIDAQKYSQIDKITFQSCKAYDEKCIPNVDLTGCIDRPKSCSELAITNCQDESHKWQKICFWNGFKCIEPLCENIITSSVSECWNAPFDEWCTINDNQNGCQSLQENCSDYGNSYNCDMTNTFQVCDWNQQKNICEKRNTNIEYTGCKWAPNDHEYTTFEVCNDYGGDFCQPVQRILNIGCTETSKYCFDYEDQSSCHKTSFNQSPDYDDCIWDQEYNFCHDIYLSPNIVFVKDVIWVEKDCSLYSLYTLYDLTIKYGKPFLQCQHKENKCNLYDSKDECTFAYEGPCYFDQTCQVATTKTDCSYFQGSYKLCEAFNPNCKGSQDSFNQQCVQKECSDYYSDGLWQGCQNDLECSVSNNYFCTPKQSSCDQYKSVLDCVQTSQTGFCQWQDSSCKSWNNLCETITITTEPNICQYYSSTCIFNKDKNKCQQQQDQCSKYLDDQSCSKAVEGFCVYKNTGQCIHPILDTDCNFINGNDLTLKDCQKFNSNCIPNRLKTACQSLKYKCNLYQNLVECTYNSNKEKCVQTQMYNSGATCTELKLQQDCNTVYLGEGLTSMNDCNLLGCTLKDDNSCQQKTCQNVPQDIINNNECEKWLQGCILNNLQNGCVKQKDKCADYTNKNDCAISIEGDCMVFNSQCVLLSCYKADPSKFSTHDSCQSFALKCTQARMGGCEDMGPCYTEISESYCNQNKKFSCHWNVIEQNCVNKICSELEQNESFDTQLECSQIKCVLRYIGKGCQDRGNCKDYNQIQCSDGSMDKNNQECGWNSNIDVPICEIKQCSTASSSIATHQDCNSYLKGCTVQISNIDDQLQIGGCILYQECSMYLAEDQCQLNQDNIECGWNGNKCDIKSCQTAPQTSDYSTHESCSKYFEGCTVNSVLFGCMEIPNTCKQLTVLEQCQFQKSGEQCIWLDEGRCTIRTCEIASPDYITSIKFNSEFDCHNFLPSCSLNEDKCQEKLCENYRYSTEEQCKNKKQNCTTDGIKCVLKHILCEGAMAKAGCTTNKNGDKCEWVIDYDPPHCVLKTCETAPTTLKTEGQCQFYFSNECTTKQNGGCTKKKKCSDANIKEACTTDIISQRCIWDGFGCRDIICSDLLGNTYYKCQRQLNGCTTDNHGKCTKITACQDFKQQNCIVGLDGPCLWVSHFINPDQSLGACFQYLSCKSLNWTTDEMCKMISPLCTTNGFNCVSITKCAEITFAIGCVTGTDGDCIKIFDNNNQFKCKKLETCSEVKFLTHKECQNASSKCTTDAVNDCIELQICSNYTKKESCIINIQGKQTKNNEIISTGKCIWREEKQKCEDVDCEDIFLDTHILCKATLSKCTSNGNFCEVQKQCAESTKCGQINGSDGICVWSATSCIAMTSCSGASNQYRGCEAAKDRCYWIQNSKDTSSQCIDHTCETYFKTNGICEKFYNWNYNQQQFCAFDSKGHCMSFDPQNYTEEQCLINTNFTFRWTSKCQVCYENVPSTFVTENFYNSILINIEVVRVSTFVSNLGLALLIYIII